MHAVQQLARRRDRLGLRADQHDRGALVIGGNRLCGYALLCALHQDERIDQTELHRLGADLLDRVGRAGPGDDVEIEPFVLVIAVLLAKVEWRMLRTAFPVEPDLHLGRALRHSGRAAQSDDKEHTGRHSKELEPTILSVVIVRVGGRSSNLRTSVLERLRLNLPRRDYWMPRMKRGMTAVWSSVDVAP